MLLLVYELALRKMASDLNKAETAIKNKEAEFEKAKKDVFDKAKELVAKRNRFYRERKQAIEKSEDLEDSLKTARSEVAQLEREKIEEAEKTKKEMDHLRQSRIHEVMAIVSLGKDGVP